jgi:hypothetical protein
MRVSPALLYFLIILETLLFSSAVSQNKTKIMTLPVRRSHRSKINKAIPLINNRNVEYLVTVRIGSQSMPYNLLIDTGSSDIWLPYYICQGCNQKNRYHCGLSRTCYVDRTFTVKGRYTDGPLEGLIAYDQFRIGPEIFLPRQSFVLVNACSGNIANVEGILGLSFNGLSMNHNPSILENLVEMKQISSFMFSLYLCGNEESKDSRLILGGIDESIIKQGGSMIWLNISHVKSFRIKFDSIFIDNNNIRISHAEAVVDSGNSCFTFPEMEIVKIRELFENIFKIKCFFYQEQYAPDFYMLDCLLDENSREFPTITIKAAGTDFPMHAKDYIYECKELKNHTIKCFTKLELSKNLKDTVLGMAFHNAYYIAFDLQKEKIGIAPSVAKNSFKVYSENGRLKGKAENKSQIFELIHGSNDPTKLTSIYRNFETNQSQPELVKVVEKQGDGPSVLLIIFIIVTVLLAVVIFGLVLYLFKILSKREVFC